MPCVVNEGVTGVVNEGVTCVRRVPPLLFQQTIVLVSHKKARLYSIRYVHFVHAEGGEGEEGAGGDDGE